MVHNVLRELKYDTKAFTPFSFAVEQLENLKNHNITAGGGTSGANAFYGGVAMGEAVYKEYPCHVYMKHMPNKTEVVWSKWVVPKLDSYAEQSRDYFDWITSDNSPWKFALDMGMSFSDKKVFNQKFWWDCGFVFDQLDKIPSNVLHNFLVASRMPKEWPRSIMLWHNLFKGGVSPEMSLVLATLFFPFSTESVNFTCNPQNPYDWPLDAAMGDEEYVTNFLHHKPVKKVFNAPYKDDHKYTPVNAIWGKAIDPNTGLPFHDGVFYGKEPNTKHFDKSLLPKLYSDSFGKTSMIGNSWDNSGTKMWHCHIKDMIEVGKLEDKRLG